MSVGAKFGNVGWTLRVPVALETVKNGPCPWYAAKWDFSAFKNKHRQRVANVEASVGAKSGAVRWTLRVPVAKETVTNGPSA